VRAAFRHCDYNKQQATRTHGTVPAPIALRILPFPWLGASPRVGRPRTSREARARACLLKVCTGRRPERVRRLARARAAAREPLLRSGKKALRRALPGWRPTELVIAARTRRQWGPRRSWDLRSRRTSARESGRSPGASGSVRGRVAETELAPVSPRPRRGSGIFGRARRPAPPRPWWHHGRVRPGERVQRCNSLRLGTPNGISPCLLALLVPSRSGTAPSGTVDQGCERRVRHRSVQLHAHKRTSTSGSRPLPASAVPPPPAARAVALPFLRPSPGLRRRRGSSRRERATSRVAAKATDRPSRGPLRRSTM
jgi:hypothetical protein